MLPTVLESDVLNRPCTTSADNLPCIFPFAQPNNDTSVDNFYIHTYNKCTMEEVCATKVDENRTMIETASCNKDTCPGYLLFLQNCI
jgi:hypothetical protein